MIMPWEHICGVGNARVWPIDPTCRYYPWNHANRFPLLLQDSGKTKSAGNFLPSQGSLSWSQSGKIKYVSAPDWIFWVWETVVGSFTGLKLSKRWFCQNHIQERDQNEFRIISYLIFPLWTYPRTVFTGRSTPNPTTSSLSCRRSGKSSQLITRRFGTRMDFWNHNGISWFWSCKKFDQTNIPFWWQSDIIQWVMIEFYRLFGL